MAILAQKDLSVQVDTSAPSLKSIPDRRSCVTPACRSEYPGETTVGIDLALSDCARRQHVKIQAISGKVTGAR